MTKEKKISNHVLKNIDKPLLYSIIRILAINYHINESLFKQEENEVTVNYNNIFGYNESGKVDFTLRASVKYKNYPDAILFSMDVQTMFQVQNFKEYIGEDKKLNLPSNFLITMVSICVGHTRALLAKQVAGTFYSDRILPIVNAYEMAKAFFGDRIENMPSI